MMRAMKSAALGALILLSLVVPAGARPVSGLSPGLAELTALEERCRPWHAVLISSTASGERPVQQWLTSSENEARAIAAREAGSRRGRFVVEPAIGSRIADALVIYESGGHPWIIGVNTKPHQSFTYATKAEAVAKASALIAAGYNVDLGLHQLNSVHLHGWLDVEAAFDPCTNVNQGGLVWADDYSRCVASYGPGSQCVDLATRAYNSGVFTASEGYARSVWDIAASLPPAVGAAFPVLAFNRTGRVQR